MVLPPHPRRLIAEDVERVQTIEHRTAVVSTAPSGQQVLDFGQNFSGVLAVHLRGEPGTKVVIRYSEALTPAGELDTEYLVFGDEEKQDDWFQRDEIILGEEPTTYCPWFTIRGFRYAAVEGSAPIVAADVTGMVMSTDIAPVARFSASDPRLEQLWSNAYWSLRSNFTDTPTDCPTRERSGWTGDIQLFGSTAVQLVDVSSFLRRYLRNLTVEQFEDGRIPPYIPSELSKELGPHYMEYVSTSVGWSDVSVLLPWTLYEYRGDERVLRDQYASARKWVDHLAWRAANTKGLHRRFGRRFGRHEKFIVDTGFHWGEWLRPGEGNTWWKSKLCPPASLATAYFANSAAVLARIAEIVGEPQDAERYRALHESAKAAWRAAFVRRKGGRIGEDKQDDYVRALAFDLLPADHRARAADRLIELIAKAGGHLGTGFLSTPLLLPALVEAGKSEVAHRLLFETSPPSWLAQVEGGATTIWEKWQAYDEDGRAHDSLNHYAFGSVVRFLHEYVAGLAPDAPGYRRIRFAPTYPAQLSSASVEIDTPYGTASSRWARTPEGIGLHVHVPGGTTGIVHLPDGPTTVGPGSHSFVFDPAR